MPFFWTNNFIPINRFEEICQPVMVLSACLTSHWMTTVGNFNSQKNKTIVNSILVACIV